MKIFLVLSQLYKNFILEFSCHIFKSKAGELAPVNSMLKNKAKYLNFLWLISWVIRNSETVE